MTMTVKNFKKRSGAIFDIFQWLETFSKD